MIGKCPRGTFGAGLTVIDEIEVVPGELCADPRLLEIDPSAGR